MRHNPPTSAAIAGTMLWLSLLGPAGPGVQVLCGAETQQSAAGRGEEIQMTVGKAVILDHPDEITRVSISNPEIADAVAVSTREILLNAKAAGVTTLVIWSRSGDRNLFTLNVNSNLDQIQQQIRATFPGEDIQISVGGGTVSLTGRVSSPGVAEKVAAMVAGPGRMVVNNLAAGRIVDRQILLKVRFAEVQRTAIRQFGVNLFSTGALNTPGSVSTQQFSPPSPAAVNGVIGGPVSGTTSTFNLSDALNVFAFRPDLNLGATIRALQSQSLIEILAEPNLIATSGKEAILLVGGEFPVPVVQGGGAAGAVTIQFREFGIRLNFLPIVTEDNTIQLHVRPEVSALDFANAATLAGFTIPALSTRRVETDVELAPGQSFVIAGLLDQRVTESLTRIPGLANIPLLGAIFRSRTQNKNDSELLVLVTPELPGPLAATDPKPRLEYPIDFLRGQPDQK
jgi:pilus assembly protein CpaC